MMNDMELWKRAYGQAPDAFRTRVESTMRRLETKAPPPVRKARWIPLIAVLLALLLGAAYALARLGLLDALHPDIQANLRPGAGELVQTAIPQTGGQLGWARFTVEEALWDGRQAYVAVRIAATDRNRTLLMDGESFPYEANGAWTEEGAPGLTFSQKAAHSGRALVSVGLWEGNDDFPYRSAAYEGEDVLYTVAFTTDLPDDVTLELCLVDLYGEMPDSKPLGQQRGELGFSLSPTDARRVYELSAPVSLSDTGATLRVCRVELTPIATYLTTAYDMDADATDQQRVLARGGFWMRWLDGEGNGMASGDQRGSLESWGDGGYTETQAFRAFDELPERIALQFYGGMKNREYEPLSVPLRLVEEETEE